MKVFLPLSLLCLASVLGESSAQTPANLLVQMARPPIDKLFKDLLNYLEKLTSNVEFLQIIDINHTLKMLITLGENEVDDLLFNKWAPALVKLLQRPIEQLRDLLVKARDFLQSQSTESVAKLLTNAKNYIDIFIRSIDQLQSSNGIVDVSKSADLIPTANSLPSTTTLPPTTTTVPPTEAPTPPPKTGGRNSWWLFK